MPSSSSGRKKKSGKNSNNNSATNANSSSSDPTAKNDDATTDSGSGSGTTCSGSNTEVCKICLQPVKQKQDSIMCDSCEQYTHRECENSLPKSLYDLLNEFPDNPLMYLCKICKPNVVANQHKVLEAIVKPIEATCSNHIEHMKSEQSKSLDFLVTKTNKLDDAMQSLKLLTAELRSNIIKTQTDKQNENMHAHQQAETWANKLMQGVATDKRNDNENLGKYPMVIYNIPNNIDETSALSGTRTGWLM